VSFGMKILIGRLGRLCDLEPAWTQWQVRRISVLMGKHIEWVWLDLKNWIERTFARKRVLQITDKLGRGGWPPVRLFRQRRRKRCTQPPGIDAGDPREQSRLMRSRSGQSTTFRETLHLPKRPAGILAAVGRSSYQEL
jgi:hypothetical protein